MSAREDPRSVRSRQAIIGAARQVFLRDGYRGATLDQVALEAGVAKRTIYNLFTDKDELFHATILSAINIADEFARSLATAVQQIEDPAAELPAIGARLAESTLLGPAVPLRRLLVMESAGFPDLVAEYRDRAPEAVMAALARLFATMAASGALRPLDAKLAAEHFAFLVMGADLDRGTFTGEHPPAARVAKRARDGVDVFLRAYLPD